MAQDSVIPAWSSNGASLNHGAQDPVNGVPHASGVGTDTQGGLRAAGDMGSNCPGTYREGFGGGHVGLASLNAGPKC